MLFDHIPCVLFAGGKSSRMGQNKALLPFGDSPSLAQYQYERLQRFFKEVYLSTKEPELFEVFSPQCIRDADDTDTYAPTIGFISAFKHLEQVSQIFVLSVDTPFVGKAVFEALAPFMTHKFDAIIARTPQGIHPMCGIYAHSLLPAFEQMLKDGNHRLNTLLKQVNVIYVDVEEVHLSNLNTPEEYKQALAQF